MNPEAIKAISEAVKERHPVSNLEELGVGQRLINLLHDNKIYDMEDLMNRRREDLLAMPHLGDKQLGKIMEALSRYHLLEN